MSEINVQLKNGEPVPVPDSATVAEALKKLDRDVAKQALAAKIGDREVDLTAPLDTVRGSNGDSVQIEPIVPQTRDGLEVLRHSTAHLLAAAVLDLFPGTKLGIGPALLDDPRYGFFYDVITPQPLYVIGSQMASDLVIDARKFRSTKRCAYLVNATSR